MGSLATRIGLAAAAGIVGLIVFGTTTWFLGDALMLLLEDKGFEPAAAAGLTGVAGLVLVALLALLAKLAMRPPRPGPARRLPAAVPPRGAAGVANNIAADLGALVAQRMVNTTRTHPFGTMGAALAAGLAVGAVPELRKILMGLLKR